MATSQAIIKITDLRLRTYIGFNPDEIKKQQDIVINIEMHYPAELARRSDDVSDALNYKDVTKKVIAHVEEGRFYLLENWSTMCSALLTSMTGSPMPGSPSTNLTLYALRTRSRSHWPGKRNNPNCPTDMELVIFRAS